MGGAPNMRMVCYACLPGSTPGTVPETLGQRHCARGAAAGGMLYTCPFIRGRAPPTLAEGQPEAARGSRGHGPLRLLSPISCPYKKWGRPPGRDPAISAAVGGTYKAPRRGANKCSPARWEEKPKGSPSADYRQTAPLHERQTQESPSAGSPKQL